jgi:uncharacterized protein
MELTPSAFASVSCLNLGIISDTHGLLRPEAVEALQGSDVILHAGDVGEELILDELRLIAPVYTIRGNVDYQYWCGRLPNTLTLTLGDLKIHMIHDIAHLDREQIAGVSLVIYGHSHKPEITDRDGVVFLNPGSAGPRRFSLPVTLAKLVWRSGDKKISPKLIQLL